MAAAVVTKEIGHVCQGIDRASEQKCQESEAFGKFGRPHARSLRTLVYRGNKLKFWTKSEVLPSSGKPGGAQARQM